MYNQRGYLKILFLRIMLLRTNACCSFFRLMSRPLAVGAGAGSFGSLLAALVAQQLQLLPSEPQPLSLDFGADVPLGTSEREWGCFLVGLLVGTLAGILLGALLDLLYLWKAHLSLQLRNRLATLQIGSQRA